MKVEKPGAQVSTLATHFNLFPAQYQPVIQEYP